MPGLIGDLVDTFNKRASGLGSYKPRKRKGFVVCCGLFVNTQRTMDIVESILREDASNTMEIVLLSREKIADSLKEQLKQFWLRRRSTVLVGNGLDPADLVRSSIRKAAGVFIFADTFAPNKELEDEQNAIRALAFDHYAPNTPLYVETLMPVDSALQLEMSTDSFCIQEFKQFIMGVGTIVDGTAALLLNLIRISMKYGRYDRPWHIPYLDGVENKILCFPTNPVFSGHLFSEISLYIFRQFQAILFAVRVSGDRIVLNPGGNYKLKTSDSLILIGHKGRLGERLKTLVMSILQ